ncbi:MAG: hypothetical protein WC211_11840 [Dehalococcoidia bacterium]
MYGYDPKNRVEQGSWRETWIFVIAAFEVIGPIMGVFLLIIAAVIGSLALLLIDARLMAIPGSLLAIGGYWLWRRERRQAAEEAERLAE